MDEFLNIIKSGAEKAFDFLLGSRDVLEYAKLAGLFIIQPASITFGLFLNHVIGSLKDPVQCPKIELPADMLLYYSTLATLSESIYHLSNEEDEKENPDAIHIIKRKKQKRNIPSEAGKVIFESTENKIDVSPFLITYSELFNQIIVTIRGSYTFADFITDLKLSAVEVDDTQMHSGVFSSSNSLFARIEDHIIQLSKEYDCPVVFTGHSLGAAIAAATARFFRIHHPEIRVFAVCFSPIATFGIEALEDTQKYITTFVLGGDPIPFLSLHNVAQVSETGYRWINSIIEEAISRETSRTLELPEGLDMSANPFEEPPPTLDKIKDDLAISARRTTALFPPGKCYHIAYEGETFKHVSLEEIQDPVDYFGALRNNSDDDHHGIKLYKDSLIELHRIAQLKQSND